MLVNLGIGIPSLVANHVAEGVSVFFQSENGLIGTGPIPEEGMADRTLTDAAGHPVSALPGASTFDSAMSFGLISGGHLDMTVLGGLQVDRRTSCELDDPRQMVPGMGGGDGSCVWSEARRRGHAAHCQPQAEDRQGMLPAARLAATGRSGCQ